MRVITAFVYTAGSLVCHQIPERSFHYQGVQFPVCARCTGLYIGGAIGLLIWFSRTASIADVPRARRLLIVCALPTIVTVSTAALGWWDPSNIWRALFAAPLGVATGLVVAAGVAGHLR